MTLRERFVAAVKGGVPDAKPTLAWPRGNGDAVIVSDLNVVNLQANGDSPLLYLMDNPFGRTLKRGVNLNDVHGESPVLGAQTVREEVESILNEAQSALLKGADGIFYVLQGARGAFCTPMQYGGWYLEADREILEAIQEATLNVVFVCGNDDVYIDFVSDLPAHLFAWDALPSTFDDAYVRTLRTGALASSDPASEVNFVSGVPSVADFLMQEPIYA